MDTDPESAASPWRSGRWWITTVLVLAAILACIAMGAWQFDRARTRDASALSTDPMAAPAVPLPAAVPTDGRVPVGSAPRPVTVVGTYVADDQVVVPGRQLEGSPGVFVVTPLKPASGPAVLVARGWVPVGSSVPPAPGFEVTVTGWLVASELLDAGAVDQLSLGPGELATVSAVRMASQVDYPLVDGYVGLVEQQPETVDTSLTPLPVPPVAQPVRWSVQSLAYAVQWWVFAAVGLAMWIQALRLERRRPTDGDAIASASQAAGGSVGAS